MKFILTDLLKPTELYSFKTTSLFILLSFFFIWSIAQVISWGIADIQVKQPQQLMSAWANNKKSFSQHAWTKAVKKINTAIKYNQKNALYYFELARLYEWNALQQPVWSEHAKSHRNIAIQYYRLALQHRPSWSSAWINLAMTQTMNMQFNDDVINAISNTIDYGIWERGVFDNVIWLGLANWANLSADLQQKIKTVISTTIHKGRVPYSVQQTAKQFQWQDQLQLLIDTTK